MTTIDPTAPVEPPRSTAQYLTDPGAPAQFHSYIPPEAEIRELTILPLIVGTVLGMIFGASSLYLVLKVGLTVSASIPVAVISITLFKILKSMGGRDATILENNIVQTAGSAGESIAFGVGVTMPAIMILGFELEITRVMLVSVLGGLLGILMMIPLRRALIVAQHGILKYPEGTACAEVLKAGASDESRAAASHAARAEAAAAKAAGAGDETRGGTIFAGFGIGFLYQTALGLLRGWKDVPEKVFGPPFAAGSVAVEASPALLGVGYIIGPVIASVMCAGGVLAYLVLIPAIKFFGGGMSSPLAPGTIPIAQMGPDDIRNAYVLYIGAGAVAAGGIISVFRSLPMIWHGLMGGLRDIRKSRSDNPEVIARTDRDMSMKLVLLGIIGIILAIVSARPLHMNILGAILIVVFGFLFVTVSSRLTGEIGSSSNPISGMTVATLLLTCLIFLILNWTGPNYYVTALSVGAIVCIAASNGGTTSQDLKTGYLVGATPQAQQIAILIGALASALILGPILLSLNRGATVYVPRLNYERIEVAGFQMESVSDAPLLTESIRPPTDAELHRLSVRDGEIAGIPAGEYVVDATGTQVWRVREAFPADLRAPVAQLSKRERIRGPQSSMDSRELLVWHQTDKENARRFLVDDAGVPVYLVDPGINGVFRTRPDGSTVNKFDAPKATLMSYIIKGILSRELPWTLVLLGVMIAVVLEMSGLPSLAFAVGVYLPISASTPILVGGWVRWGVDRYLRRKYQGKNMTEDQLIAEGDKSPGVLLASGYIAGGAIAGILIAFFAGLADGQAGGFQGWLARFNDAVARISAGNPFYSGPSADLLAMIPFVILTAILYLTGREIMFKSR